MDWIPLIAATVRLVDLHDSDRVPGDSASRFNLYRESRPGNHDGHLAAATIDFLVAQSARS